MKKINTIIFDYGGTLDTDARHWAHVLFEGYRHAQIPVDEPNFRDAYVYGERALAKAPIVLPDDDFHTVLLKKSTKRPSSCATTTSGRLRKKNGKRTSRPLPTIATPTWSEIWK